MPYDTDLADRVRKIFECTKAFAEKKMFGGVGFLHNGNMCVGIWKDHLVARIGPDSYEAALDEPHVREFDITGRPMRGWIMIEPDGIDSSDDLRTWIERAFGFVERLPAK